MLYKGPIFKSFQNTNLEFHVFNSQKFTDITYEDKKYKYDKDTSAQSACPLPATSN